jgi:2-polyprenyl-3-methyl-5-hydroxy-6-metoxy-1,4-benzoquinol methylase
MIADPPPSDYVYIDDVRDDILRMVPSDGKVIGTIGCGRARTESVLVQQGREVHGVDLSGEAIKTAVDRLTSARTIVADEELPFAVGSLDGLILADVIEHLPLAWQRLQVFSTMVKPGGWVVISVPNMRYLGVLYKLVVRGEWEEAPMGIFDRTHVQVMTHRRLQRWCTAAGLDRERWSECYDHRFFQRNVCRALNLVTLRLFRSFLNTGVQGVFRRKAS